MISQRIKELRSEKKLTQNELASLLGIAKTTLAAYEQGKNEPSISMLIKMAHCFNVSTDYLIGLTQSRLPENRNISEELNLSDKAIEKMKQFTLVIDKYNGISLADILNAIIVQPEFDRLLKSILLTKTRTSEDWNKMKNYMNEGSSSLFSQEQVKELDRLRTMQEFNNIVSHVTESEITTYNTIIHNNDSITISKHDEAPTE